MLIISYQQKNGVITTINTKNKNKKDAILNLLSTLNYKIIEIEEK